jgi:hypothetical protein
MPSKRLDRLSDLFFAVGDAIIALNLGVNVGNYNEFAGDVVGDGTILIEIEGTKRVARSNEGRTGHRVRVTLHAVVGGWREHANLEAANLASVLQDLVDDTRWGLPGRQCSIPEEMSTGPSMYSEGRAGYEAWCVTFWQTIYLGPSLLEEDPVITALPKVAYSWQVPSVSDPGNYQPIEVA